MEQVFQYKSEIQEIPLIRKNLAKLAREWDLPESESRQIGVIIEELFSNIIRFAFEDNLLHQIELRLTKTENVVSIEIIDDGIPFNLLDYEAMPSKDPAAYETGGMGLTLVRTFSDSIAYNRSDHKNHLEITKTTKSRKE